MKTVILCAGRGARMNELTIDTPKPMLMYRGKNLVEWKLEALPEIVNEVILVVGYHGEKIRRYFGSEWNGRKINYIEQKELLGTADALFCVKDLLDTSHDESFMVLMGDDIYSKDDLQRLSEQDDWTLLFDDTRLVYTGACKLTPKVFELPMVKIEGKEEYGLPQTLMQVANERTIRMIGTKRWKRVTSGEDLR